MGKSLLIVESPTKARTLNRYLGDRFDILASVGHVKDLPENELGIDIDNKFEPHYKIIKGKEKVIRELRKAAKQAENIYLAPDPDREENVKQEAAEQAYFHSPDARVGRHEIGIGVEGHSAVIAEQQQVPRHMDHQERA